MHHKDQHHRVYLQRCTLEPHPQRNIRQDPALGHPVGHEGVQSQRGRDRGAFEVLALTGGIFGERGNGHVEAGEAGEAGEDKKTEAEGVDGRAETEGCGHRGWGETERYLQDGVSFGVSGGRLGTYEISKGVEFLSHEA